MGNTTTLAQDKIAPYVTQKVCKQIKKDKTINKKLKTDICIIIEIMIDKNIKNQKIKKELLEMINMEKRKTALEYIIEQETQQLKEEIQEKDEKLTNLISEIKNYYSKKGQIPKEILSALLKI